MTDPAPTRREGGAPDRPDGFEPVPTRRETAAGATRREDVSATPPVTRREGGDGAYLPISPEVLPAELAERLSGFTPLPTTGAEAQLMRVSDAEFPGAPRVLKIYYPQIRPDPRVWSELTRVQSRHVVDVHQTGELRDGRFYELMEYLPGGSLRAVGAGRETFSPEQITDIVAQLADGLAALHALDITHRDLKPENVLVRSVDPLTLAVTDFGLSRRLDASIRLTSVAMTAAYAGPETYTGMATKATDWWSLGIMVLELATGQRAFEGLDERVIQFTVTTKAVPVEAIADPRLRRLCAGLLVGDTSKRWSQAEVAEWLAGGSPPVPDRRVPVEVPPFDFADQKYTRLDELAAAMVASLESWQAAARRFGVSPSVGWSQLVHWLGQLPDVDTELGMRLDELPSSDDSPDVKLVRLLALLNPKLATALPPMYRGRPVDRSNLRALAVRAQQHPTGEEARVIGDLYEGALLQTLAEFADAAELREINARWVRAVADLDQAEHALDGLQPDIAVGLPDADGRSLSELLQTQDGFGVARLAAMLEVSVDGSVAQDWASATAADIRQLPVPLPWFADLAERAGTDPARRYLAWRASGVAAAQAQAVLRAREAAERARVARQQQWAAHEDDRLARRSGAIGRALGAAAVLAVLWICAAGLAGGRSPAAAGVLVLVAIVHLVAEPVLANTLAGDYHPRYALGQWLGRSAGSVGWWMRDHPFWSLLGIIFAVGALTQVSPLLILVAAGAAIAHIVSTVTRYHSWIRQHDADQQRVLHQ